MSNFPVLDAFALTTIPDPSVRQAVIELMNLVEELHAQVGKPKILPQKKGGMNISSEQERSTTKASQQTTPESKPIPPSIPIDRVEVRRVDPQMLPDDVQFKGYEEIIVQDVVFHTDNVKFRREKFYSPKSPQTYLAALPAGYHGHFGPGVRAWVLALYFSSGMSEPKIIELLRTVGRKRSAGQLSNLLIHDQESWHGISAEVVRAGLASSPGPDLDSTATRVDGQNHNCHILCNPFYTAYCTTLRKDRLSMLKALQGGSPLVFLFNQSALDLAGQKGLAKKWAKVLVSLLPDQQEMTEEQVAARPRRAFREVRPTGPPEARMPSPSQPILPKILGQ